MDSIIDLPDYQYLFGELDFKTGDDARSAYSPAAYLTDLLQLLDDKFETSLLDERRADLKKIVLNQDNTFTLIPYLDIVNEVLEDKIGGDVYEKLTSAPYPFNLPFNLGHEGAEKCLTYLGLTAEQLYKQFSPNPDSDMVARIELGLSVEEYELLTTPLNNEADIKDHYQLGEAESWADLTNLERFLQATHLTGQEIRDLLFQNLSVEATNMAEDLETVRAATFFINNVGLSHGYVKFNTDETSLIWSENANKIPSTWFEPVNRFVRLAQKLGLSFTNLDLILRSCCDNRIDRAAIRTLAVIIHLHKHFDLPIDVVCGLLSPINTLGIGDGTTPLDIFNQIFNVKFAAFDKAYISGSDFTPTSYGEYLELRCSGDLLALDNKAYRSRVVSALGMSHKDLVYIITQYREKYAKDETESSLLDATQEIGVPALSLLYRIQILSEMLDISYPELFTLLDILERDPAIKQYSSFNVLIEDPILEQDCYKILAGSTGSIPNMIWLIQTLIAVVEWMHANDLSPEELNQIASGTYLTTADQESRLNEKIGILNNLYQSLEPALLHASTFISHRFNDRSSRVIHQTVTAETSQETSTQDNRLVRANSTTLKDTAYRALTQLAIIQKEDFFGLGLEEEILDKIYNTLILKGYLNSDGMLMVDHFPKMADEFELTTDFSAYREPLFALIQHLNTQTDEVDQESIDENDLTEGTLFLADLAVLEGLSERQRAELYDNLLYNQYIDDEGELIQPDFFAYAENVDSFQINVDLGMASTYLFNQILEQVRRFEKNDLLLDKKIFMDLPLNPTEVEALIVNLQFNEYIDEKHILIAKERLPKQTAEQFSLALEFYPHRHGILAALQQQIAEFKMSFYTFSQESFRGVAERIIAQQIMDYLHSGYLDDSNRIRPEVQALVTDNDQFIAFDQLTTILMGQQKYQFSTSSLEQLAFSSDESAELVGILQETAYLTELLMIPAHKISYFLNINNALEFSIEAFEDYNKDVFFLLHDVAKETHAAIQEIAATLRAVAQAQEDALFAGLQEAFGLHVESVRVLCRHLFQGLDRVVEEFMLPILSTVDDNNRITKIPDNHKFNVAYERLNQFALLATKLRLSPEEIEVIFHDQNLVTKFPEKLALPQNEKEFDTLLQTAEMIYLFKGDQYWTYGAKNYNLIEMDDHQLTALSKELAGVAKIDAAFTDHKGTSYLITGENCFQKEPGQDFWVKQERAWGKVKNEFDEPEKIDGAFQDDEGKTYLFVGTQYVRYSGTDYTYVDEGYPRSIANHWQHEGQNAELPAAFQKAVGASFQGTDGKAYLFKDDKYVCSGSLADTMEVKSKWGHVRNNFVPAQQIDGGYVHDAHLYLFRGNQVIAYQDSIENDHVNVLEGYPKQLEAFFQELYNVHIPAEFESGVESALFGEDGQVHLFKNGKTVAFKAAFAAEDDSAIEPVSISTSWGIVTNRIVEQGTVDAAFVGLDGKTYLFSGDQYIRYSGADYAQVDSGYPRTISGDWGGLTTVHAAFVMDGKTYLFGTPPTEEEAMHYVRYSTNDYSEPDEGYPKEPNDNWWNLPYALVEPGASFEHIDAVFNGKDGNTYLFAGDQFITYDHRLRWWSEPQETRTHWLSLPSDFATIDAAFTGKDGKTYLFSGDQYIRYSSSNFSRIDDRYPNKIVHYWGNVVNNIAKTDRIDALFVVESHEQVDGVEQTNSYTYLFSGDQYYRYVGDHYATVESGYPRYIATSLPQEPRFQNLAIALDKIDAGFADQRMIYLFKEDQCHVISDRLYKVYDGLGFKKISSALIEDGALFIEEDGLWHRYSSLEGKPVQKIVQEPAMLRNLPEEQDDFRHGLNAVLHGVDQNSYLFKGDRCFNLLLNKAYPLAEEWGRTKNNIYIQNSIDAAFVGRDQKTYLFSGDQFFVYDSPNYVDGTIQGHPQSIQEQWGGLTHVALAFVRNEKTYLFERANDDGTVRYLSYSTDDYTQPDTAIPQIADMDFWGIPEEYAQDFAQDFAQGFDSVQVVLFDEENMFLLNEERYLQYHEETETWAYPRPVERFWEMLDFDHHDFPAIKTAFTGADGVTYFFAEEKFISYGINMTPMPINEHWGLVQNNFVQMADGSSKIDAVFVYQDKITYLFSGNQYVRYSGFDYQYVDEGYPKAIVKNLRQEVGFKNLPDELEALLVNRVATGADPVIDAIVANARNIYIFIDNQYHVVSQNLTATYELDIIGQVKNHLVDDNRVDAAFVTKRGETYLFSGDQYVRYSDDDYSTVDDGYPKSIGASFAEDIATSWSTAKSPASFAPDFQWPAQFANALDAAYYGADGTLYLCKGRDTLMLSLPSDNGGLIQAATQPIKELWGKVENRFAADKTIDAGFISPSGGLYLFKDDQYIRYQTLDQEFVDEGYPKAIRDNWGSLPAHFEEGIDGGFVFEGKSYLIKGDTYIRYANSDYQQAQNIYPQKFANHWGAWADYQLNDLQIITRFKQLQEKYSSDQGTLATFLHSGQDAIPKPYQMLADLFGWDIDDVQWLKRQNGFIQHRSPFEDRYHLELVLRLFDQLALAKKMGASPSDIYQNVWQNLYPPTDLKEVTTALYRYLGTVNSPQDWQMLARQLHDELNVMRRDVLVPYLIAHTDGIDNERDLYAALLIDTEMDSCGDTSRIKEAIAAVQLYFHRYLVNLEGPALREDSQDEVAAKQEIKEWWKWMKNYRVWEANRKVFLYPENYIRPELRDTKTPAFKTLEEDLLQGEITDATVQQAYKKYLDEYTEVSRLTIAGGYIYDDPDDASGTADEGQDKNLVLFGRTKTDPRRYYYRIAKFLAAENGAALWGPWLPVNIQIDGDHVYPVFAFNRVFVFWAKIDTVDVPISETPTSRTMTTTTDGDSQTIRAKDTSIYTVKVFYSFYNLNKEWVQPQALDAFFLLGTKIDQLQLQVENSTQIPELENENAHENILINCAYWSHLGSISFPINQAFRLTPELYTQPADSLSFDNRGKDIFSQILDEPDIDEKSVVALNSGERSSDGPWFSFDHKGGSFLCKPAAPSLPKDAWPKQLLGNRDGFPEWSRIDAAFHSAGGQSTYFNNTGKVYVTTSAVDDGLAHQLPIQKRWGKVRNNIAEQGIVDAVVTIGEKSYIFSGNQYLTYSDGLKLADAQGPKVLSTNDEGLPQWDRVDAAFTGQDGQTYFFNSERKIFVIFGDMDNPMEIRERWGQLIVRREGSTSVDVFADTIDAAFVRGDHTYLFSGTHYIRYTGESYAYADEGYPKPIQGNEENLPDWTQVDAAFTRNERSYFFANSEQIYTTSARLENKRSVQERWGIARNNFTEFGVVDSAHIRENQLYLTSGNHVIRYTLTADTPGDYVDGGYPQIFTVPGLDQLQAAFTVKVEGGEHTYLIADGRYLKFTKKGNNFFGTRHELVGKLGVLLSDLGIIDVPVQYHNLSIHAAYVHDDHLHIYTSGQKITCALQERHILSVDDRSNENVNFAYVNGQSQLQIVTDRTYDAALAVGKKFYLFKGDEYIELNEIPATITAVEWVNPQKITDRWSIGKIDATFMSGNVGYAFINDRYFTLGLGEGTMRLGAANAIQGSWGNLPAEFRSGIDAALQRGQGLYLFQGGRYVHYNAETQPYEVSDAKYDIIRLTTSTAYKLNSALFSEGVPGLLSLATQNIDELPGFSETVRNPTTIRVKPGKVSRLPISEHLDFHSANGLYYWEIFFHAPFLIAQSLNAGQKFEEAKEWHEYIYDPTEVNNYWKFLPFNQEDTSNTAAEIAAYLDDPFDPHAIARLRKSAYRKAIVMRYVDNLLDWGDMLFRQYTRESINEARMLYILAYDLLGEKPENLGTKLLSTELGYHELIDDDAQRLIEGDDNYDFLVYASGTAHAGAANPYFFVPENRLFTDYWTRVEDRLYKIRHCLNIMGIKQPLPLFQPPIDPMALVQAVGSGAGLSSALASMSVPVPHYRFDFMLRKAQELVQQLSQFSGELLNTLEKRDGEELSLLQNRQEGIILTMTQSIKEAQLGEARANIEALEASLAEAKHRASEYQRLISADQLPAESAQIGLMYTAAGLHTASSVLKAASGIAYLFPEKKFGVFILGAEYGGREVGTSIDKFSETLESVAEGLSMTGEALGITAQHQRMVEDWQLQQATAESDVIQIGHQLAGAALQEKIAQREIELLAQEIKHNDSIKTFMQGKFSNAQLYQWMASRLSGLYFQTYKLAHDMAKSAERAYQFEQGMQESEVSYIQPVYWDSQKKGLLAGESLGLDLDRMEKAFIEGDSRGLEISKNISLLELDPVAFLQLQRKGVCEFSLTEALFDYDFQGHYCRQIKTISITFQGDAGPNVMATLTQLNHKTLLEPDAKAVKFLLMPKDQPPTSIRNDWRASQQIVLSHVDEYKENNGLFELRYDDPRYLPFEGTGAISTWRLELNGKRGSYNVNDLLNVTLNLKYTAEQGGRVFADAVRGMLKPYLATRFFDIAAEFPDEWEEFVEGDEELVLPFSRDMFPNMGSSKITGIFTMYSLFEPGEVSMILNDDDELRLDPGKHLATSNLRLGSEGSDWTFALDGERDNLANVYMVVSYQATV